MSYGNYELINGYKRVIEQEWQEHDLLLPFGEVGTYIAKVNKRDDDFTTIDNSTISRVIKAGCIDQMTIYLLLHQRSYTDDKTGKLVAKPTTYAWLMKETGLSLTTVKNHIKRLNDAQLINCYSTRQMTELGNSTQDGNCYGINYRRYTGDETIKVKDSIIKQYSEQVIILTGRNNDLTEQVAYWTNLYREMPVAIRPARKRVGGRTEKDTQVVSVRLSSDLVAQLDAVASATGASRTSLLEALMQTRQTLDDLSNETKEAHHSTPQRIYDQIAKLRKERTEDGERRYPLSHIDRLAEFYALVKKNYGWVSNSPATLSRKQIADVFDCSLETAGDLVEVARQTGFVFAERNNYTENGKTITKGYHITLALMTASESAEGETK